HQVMCRHRKIIVLGDFNINFNSDSNECIICKNVFLSFNLVDIVNENTRVTSKSETRIDNVFTNVNVNSVNTHIFKPHFSDHKGILLNLTGANMSTNSKILTKTFRIINIKENKEKFKIELSKISWNSIYACQNKEINQPWNEFTKIL